MTFDNAQKMASPTTPPLSIEDLEREPLTVKTVYAANGCETCNGDVLQISATRIRCERDASHTVRFERLARPTSLPPR